MNLSLPANILPMFSLTPHSPSGVVQLMPPGLGLVNWSLWLTCVDPHRGLVLGSDLNFLTFVCQVLPFFAPLA
jgi:hypothetical protein